MTLRLQINVPTGSNSDSIRGQLLSLLNAIEEVGTRKRKGSFIVHFFQERLDKRERRILLSILNQLQNQLLKKDESINEGSKKDPLDTSLPSRVAIILKRFQELG
jgi:hypothetical protein